MPTVQNVKSYPLELDDGTTLLPGRTKNINTTLPHAVKLIAGGALSVLDSLPAPSGAGSSSGEQGAQVGVDWPRFLRDGSGYTPETIITKANASNLTTASRWPKAVAYGLVAQPAVADGLVFAGDVNGVLHAWAVAGDLGDGWSRDLSIPGGIYSTPLVETMKMPGDLVERPIVFIGGGGSDTTERSKLFALDALTGTILWTRQLGQSAGNMIWASPVSRDGFIYIGLASVDDSPLVQGLLFKVNMTTGVVAATYKVVPDGSTGGGIWGSVVFDDDGTLFVVTGNEGAGLGQTHTLAILRLDTNFVLLDSWRNAGAVGADLDFGSTPILFHKSDGTKLVGVGNKDGNFYIFNRGTLSAGPVTTLAIAVGGANPEAGDGIVSPAAWDGSRLYVVGGNTTISGTPYGGSVRCYNPDNFAAPIWAAGFAGHPVDAVTVANGIAVIGAGTHLYVLDADTGAVVHNITSTGVQEFLAAAVISGGVIYAISSDFSDSSFCAYTTVESLLPDQVGGGGGGGGGGSSLVGFLRPRGLGLKAQNMHLEGIGSSTYAFVDGYLFLQKLQFEGDTVTAAAIAAFCGSPSTPTTVIASLYSLAGTTATLIEEILDAHDLFNDYLQRKKDFAIPHDVTGDILVGYYCTGGSMPQTMRASGTNFGEGFGPGIDKRANSFVFLGAVAHMPSTIDLSTSASLNEWPTAGLA